MIRRLKYIFLGAAIVLTGTVVAQQATRFLNVRVLEDLEVDQTATLNALSVQTGPVTLPAASISDSALSSNVPLKDAPNQFTSTGAGTGSIAVQVVADTPYYGWTETDQDADEQRWVAGIFNSIYRFSPVPDSFTGSWTGSGITPSIEVRRDEADTILVALASTQEI